MSSPKRRSGENVTNPPGYLATQDLKERGWTVPLITRFLGQHDQTRPNGIKMGRRRLPPVKLYLETRVEQAENDEDFLTLSQQAQERRERAAQRRAQKLHERAEHLAGLAQQYQPRPAALGIRKGAVRQARAPYLAEVEEVVLRAQRSEKMSPAETKELRRLLHRQLDRALSRIYPWFPDPEHTSTGASTARSKAQPADWQSWDWD